jgi:hypothetical protein
MKSLSLAYLSVFALVACTPPGTPPVVGATSELTPTSYAAGTASNTTTAFDGNRAPDLNRRGITGKHSYATAVQD